jgi:hypothetical protein
MTHRPPKLPLASRIIAAACVVIWMAGVSVCDLESLFCCESQGGETAEHADQQHSHDTEHAVADTNEPHNAGDHHSGETEGHSHDSPVPDGKEGSCCSTLKAVAQTSTSAVFSKPAPLPISFLYVPVETHSAALALLQSPPNRCVKNCDRILTPEVCLGPAFQSNAPPALG